MAGRPREFDELELIDRATEVFWRKGYNNSSSKDLMKAMKVGQGSFYLNFKGGKKELYRKSLLRAWKLFRKEFIRGKNESDNNIEFLKTFFRSVLFRPIDMVEKGCFAGNTLVESSCVDDELQDLATKLLVEFEESIEELLIEIQNEGLLDKSKNPKIIAKYFLNFWNGINITLRIKNASKEQIEEMIKLNLSILD